MAARVPRYVYDSILKDADASLEAACEQVARNFREDFRIAEEGALAKLDLNKFMDAKIRMTTSGQYGSGNYVTTDRAEFTYFKVSINAHLKDAERLVAIVDKATGKIKARRDAKLHELRAMYQDWKLELYNKLIDGDKVELPNFSKIVNAK